MINDALCILGIVACFGLTILALRALDVALRVPEKTKPNDEEGA